MLIKAEGRRQKAESAVRVSNTLDFRRRTSDSAPRRGVILLVVMVLLALMTLMGLTLVLVTSQGRLSALAASRSIQPEQEDKELWSVTTQVVAGSTDPNSSFGAHGLLEDLYGLPQFFGQIAPQSPASLAPVLPMGGGGVTASASGSTALTSGQLLQLIVVAGNAYATGLTGANAQAGPLQYSLPTQSGALCGQVITMLTGPAAGQSARVTGYFYDPNNGLLAGVPFATMQVSSFNGLVPNPSDQFIVNGRPYSGTGFGFNLMPFQTGVVAAPWQPAWLLPTATPPVYGNVPLLNAVEAASTAPYAYLPNHARITLTGYAPTTPGGAYWDPAGPGGANEPYDAPDFQNLMLAMHYYNSTGGNVVTPIPSLHRPELVGWYYNQVAGSMATPAMRRKVILRPEPTDHWFNDLNANGVWDAREPFYDANGTGKYDTTPLPADTYLDLNGDGSWTPGDTDYSGNMFNPDTGCWYIAANGSWALDTGALGLNGGQGGLDVDNDMDGIPDSIWVDAALPVHTEADGTITKNLAAILCIEMDGKLNLNAHGNLAQLDTLRYSGSVTIPTTGKGVTMGQTTLYNAAGVDRYIPMSQGYGPPDVNLGQLFLRAQSANATAALNYYQLFLQGYGNPAAPVPVQQFVDGRHGESSRLTQAGNAYPGIYPPGSYAITGAAPPYSASSPPLPYTNQLFNGPRPGYSQWYDPYATATLGFDWVNDATLLARLSDYRPLLLTPWLQTTVPFFFDFITPTAFAPRNTLYHLPTAHGSPSDLLSRGLLVTDFNGRPYYAGTATVPWLTSGSIPAIGPNPAVPGMWQSTMTDYAVGLYVPPTGTQPALTQEVVLNEMVDNAYETDLTRQAAREGRNTGNNNFGSDFVSIESPLLPSELESLLRSHEWGSGTAADSSTLALRLNNLETAASYYTTKTVPANTLPSSLRADSIRLSVTSESWDVPAPNVALTPQQIEDLVTFTNAFWAVAGKGTLNINNAGVADLARARIFTENLGNGSFSSLASADLALFGNLKNIRQSVPAFPPNNNPMPPLNPAVPVWPLLAPETILGMRLDVNRLLGNGQDDNGNGVVDEPAEVLWQWTDGNGKVHGECLVYPSTQTNPVPGTPVTGTNKLLGALDLNNDGFYAGTLAGNVNFTDPQTGVTLPSDPTNADMRARQLLARHLYVAMMLVLDDRNMSAQVFDATCAQLTTWSNWPNYAAIASLPQTTLQQRTQAAYVIAQWAINAVDFRDRDSISTPFEFDIFPFAANDPTNPNATWNVDDIVAPFGTLISPDDLNPLGVRGLVWGCERPELLLTETVAFHDRGTDDTNQGEPSQAGGSDYYTVDPNNPDPDYDQVRRPRGSLIVEMFNPTGYWDAPQLDLQYNANLAAAGLPQPWQSADMNGNIGAGVNLAQVAVGQSGPSGPPASPVWRLVIGYSPWWNESAFYTGWTASPAGQATPQGVDPRVPVLPPTAIHRAVYFTPYQPTFITGTTTPGVVPTSPTDGRVNEISRAASFFADPDVLSTVGTATLMLPPGQYALVGPAAPSNAGVDTIYLGLNGSPGTVVAGSQQAIGCAQYLQLGNQAGGGNAQLLTGPGNTIANWLVSGGTQANTAYTAYTVNNNVGTGYNASTSLSTTIKPVIGVPIQTNWLDTTGAYVQHNQALNTPPGANVASTLRMSVSEPEHGYPRWPASGGTGLWRDDDAYYSGRGQPNKTAAAPLVPVPNFPQHPFDSGLSTYLVQGDLPNAYVAPDGSTNGPNMTMGYTVVYLQRLANPLAAWDLYANPYLTVDSMPVDLTAYTGENQPVANALASKAEPAYQSNGNWTPYYGGNTAFDTRRRGYNATGAQLSEGVPDVWTPLPTSLPNPYDGNPSLYGNLAGTLTTPLPKATLGFLNSEYGTYYTGDQAQVSATSSVPAYQYNGDPVGGFPWIAWNNRPYISQYELMLVPGSSPSSLPYDFGMIGWATGSSINEYAAGTTNLHKSASYTKGSLKTSGKPITATTSSPGAIPVAQFGYLLNFFDNTQTPATPIGTYMPNMFRVFEYLQVPSRFTATQEMMNPTFFSGDNAAAPSAGAMVGASHLFHTPFNWLSRYRDPGRINLNTVFDPVVFQGLMDDFPGSYYASGTPTPLNLWQQLLYSRQGYTSATLPLTAGSMSTDFYNPLNPPNPVAMYLPTSSLGMLPTYFTNPIRPDGSGAFVPQTSATSPITSALMQSWNYPGFGLTYNGVNTTMLRSQNPTTGTSPFTTSTPGSMALFDDTNFDSTNLNLTSPGSGNSYRNPAANDYFQYQMFTRLGNLTTNRSNVYAIWVTLGKFEVQPIGVSATNPDGYRLVKPYLDDTGNQATTRGFYIFDRSIPMGFQRGQDLNIENGFLLERVLKESD
jgi:hypothetical protein